MNWLYLSWRHIAQRPLHSLLSVVLFALGAGLIGFMLLLNSQLQRKFEQNLAGVEMVVGAEGSPLQLILSSMYHVDNPTGNIALAQVQGLMRSPALEYAVPLGLGDSYAHASGSYRIIGTMPAYLDIYGGQVREGRLWEAALEVCIGAYVAEKTGLRVGDTFFSSHGLQGDVMQHDDVPPFRVVGILEKNGSVIDQLILCALPSIWLVHSGHADADGEHAHDEHGHEHAHELPAYDLVNLDSTQDITAMLVKFKNRMAAINLPRYINEQPNLQAASPAYEINRLYELMGNGEQALRGLALLIMVVSGFSIFISLYTSLDERRYELALLRVAGATRGQLLLLVVGEGLLLALLGAGAGFVLAHGGMVALSDFLANSYRYDFSGLVFLRSELALFGAALGIGLLAAALPAAIAFRTDISATLGEG